MFTAGDAGEAPRLDCSPPRTSASTAVNHRATHGGASGRGTAGAIPVAQHAAAAGPTGLICVHRQGAISRRRLASPPIHASTRVADAQLARVAEAVTVGVCLGWVGNHRADVEVVAPAVGVWATAVVVAGAQIAGGAQTVGVGSGLGRVGVDGAVVQRSADPVAICVVQRVEGTRIGAVIDAASRPSRSLPGRYRSPRSRRRGRCRPRRCRSVRCRCPADPRRRPTGRPQRCRCTSSPRRRGPGR